MAWTFHFLYVIFLCLAGLGRPIENLESDEAATLLKLYRDNVENDDIHLLNQETRAMQGGENDLALRKGIMYNKPKDILCLTFQRANAQVSELLKENMGILKGHCDWAIVIYRSDKNDQVHINLFCENEKLTNVVFCKAAPDMGLYDVLPKSVLFREIIPYLSIYSQVFFIDGDISLLGFDPKLFFELNYCSFHPHSPPMISQPLIEEPFHHSSMVAKKYLHRGAWISTDNADVLVSAAGLVEMQIFVVNSEFFRWFILHVLTRTVDVSLKFGADEGLERTWCVAARTFGIGLLGYSKGWVPCTVITAKGTSVHHIDTKQYLLDMIIEKSRKELRHKLRGTNSDENIYLNKIRILREYFRNSTYVMQSWKELYPSWVIRDNALNYTNPLDHTGRYKMKRKVTDCLGAKKKKKGKGGGGGGGGGGKKKGEGEEEGGGEGGEGEGGEGGDEEKGKEKESGNGGGEGGES